MSTKKYKKIEKNIKKSSINQGIITSAIYLKARGVDPEHQKNMEKEKNQ